MFLTGGDQYNKIWEEYTEVGWLNVMDTVSNLSVDGQLTAETGLNPHFEFIATRNKT